MRILQAFAVCAREIVALVMLVIIPSSLFAQVSIK
jgi:hypothetical protein